MSVPRVVAVLQARMGSTRLPGKMLRELGGRPLVDYGLARLCGQLKPAGPLDAVVLATPVSRNNDPLVAHVRASWPQVRVALPPRSRRSTSGFSNVSMSCSARENDSRFCAPVTDCLCQRGSRLTSTVCEGLESVSARSDSSVMGGFCCSPCHQTKQ